jgi:hypothetical protein
VFHPTSPGLRSGAAALLAFSLLVAPAHAAAPAGGRGPEQQPAAVPVPAPPLDCIRSANPDAFLPPGAVLGEPGADLSPCRTSKRGLACAVGGGFAEAAGDGRLLDFDRTCESAKCGKDTGPTRRLVRIHGPRGIELRELALSCRIIEGTDDAVGPDEERAPRSHTTDGTCGDYSNDGSFAASDALGTLRTAVGTASCIVCVCDVNRSNSVTSADALLILRKAVGQIVTLDCQADGEPISWDAGGDGVNWTDPLNWSLDRTPNACNAVTIATGSVQLNSGNHGVRSLVSSVPLDFNGGRLDVRASVTASGLTRMKGGNLARAHWMKPGNDAPLTTTTGGGTLDGVHLIGDLDMTESSTAITITNGLTLDGKATLAASSSMYFPASPKIALEGGGEVLLQSGNSYLYNFAATNLTLGAGLLIHGSAGSIGGNQGNTLMTSAATIDSDGGGTLSAGPPAGTWSSSGLLRASNGTLNLQGAWTNTGTIDVETAGVLNLGGSFKSSTFGTFERTGGTVNLTGTFTLDTPFELNPDTGSWRLAGGTLKDGELDADGDAKLLFTTSGGSLNNVVMNADMDLTPSSSSVTVVNGLTLNGVATLSNNSSIYFPASSEVAIDGTGDVLMQSSNSYLYNYGGTNLHIGSGLLIHGSGGHVGGNQGSTLMTTAATIDSDAAGTLHVGPASGTWTNLGTLRASNGTLSLQGAWTSSGTIAVEGAGTLNLGGTFNSTGFGTLDRDGGTINLTGTMTLGTPFTLNAGTGDWRLVGGTFKDGTLNSADGAKVVFTTSGGTLSNVVMNADLVLTGSSTSVNVTNGLTLNGVATLGSNSSIYLPASSEVAIDGTGDILMQSANSYLYNYGGTNMSLGSGLLVHGSAGSIGGNQGNTMMSSAATIDSDGGGTLKVGPASGTWSNSGTVRASNGTATLQGGWSNTGTIALETTGILNLGGAFTTTGFGTFDRDGGTVNLTGVMTLDAPFTLNTATGNWRIAGGTLKDGTINSADGAKLVATSSGGMLSNVVLNADLDMTSSSSSVSVTNGLTLNGVITLSNNSSLYLPVSSEVGIDGTGDILMQSASSFLYNYGGTSMTLGSGLLIHGSGGNVGGNQGNTTLTTAATIDSDAAGNLTVGPPSGTWTNAGAIKASTGNIALAGNSTNNGDLYAAAGRTIAAATFTQGAGGELALDIAGTMPTQFGKLSASGTATLAGTLAVTLTNGFVPTLGNTFQILTFASSTGSLGTFTGSDIPGPNRFAVTTNPTNLTLAVVPD